MLSRALTAPGDGIEPIRPTFGAEMIDAHGIWIEPACLAFADPSALQQLEAILPPDRAASRPSCRQSRT